MKSKGYLKTTFVFSRECLFICNTLSLSILVALSKDLFLLIGNMNIKILDENDIFKLLIWKYLLAYSSLEVWNNSVHDEEPSMVLHDHMCTRGRVGGVFQWEEMFCAKQFTYFPLFGSTRVLERKHFLMVVYLIFLPQRRN